MIVFCRIYVKIEQRCVRLFAQENTKEIIKMIKNMVMVHIIGQMVKLTKECGITENNMVRQSLLIQKVEVNMEFGKMVKE